MSLVIVVTLGIALGAAGASIRAAAAQANPAVQPASWTERWLSRWIGPGKFVRAVEGSVAVEVRVGGTRARPTLQGQVTFEGARVTFAHHGLPALEDLRGRIVFEEGRVSTEGLTATLGHETVTMRGVVSCAWNGSEKPAEPEEPAVPELTVSQVSVTLQGRRLLVFSDDDCRLRLDADLRLTGDARGATLSGRIAPADVRWYRDLSFREALSTNLASRLILPCLPGPWGRWLRLDVRVEPGRGFDVDNNLANLHVEPELRVTGTAARPQLEGRVSGRGKIRAPALTFQLEHLRLEFSNHVPVKPTIRARARARIVGVDVTITARGSLDRPVLDFTSDPQLPREDLAVLVALGATRPDLTRLEAPRQVDTPAVRYLLRRFFPIHREEPTDLLSDLLDRISVESVPARTPLDAGSQVRAQFRLLDYLYLQGESDRYGNYNGDVMFRFRLGWPERVSKRREAREPTKPAAVPSNPHESAKPSATTGGDRG